ncbi:MAG: decaprenyl-phosphate phosphoribosyltransferase [Deltaproteobacteria bacterium]|nr:decaprenyl-phosphate phosphoribosyltransferase [Deltaproteobacteria bacterium]
MLYDLLLLSRPRQWIKNLFIFFPLFFALQIYHPAVLLKAGLAFVVFCALASGLYIMNDYHDVDEDRLHPQKKLRPFAAGRISGNTALFSSAVLLISGLIAAWFLGVSMFCLALIYIALNVVYTIKLKHIPIIDIFIVAFGYVIRIFVGGAVTGIKIYPWIVIMTFLLALLLALGKRRDDVLILLNNGEKVKKSVDGYNLAYIDGCMMVTASITIVSYIMYTMSPEVITRYKTDHLYLTAVFVMIGIMRYLQVALVEQQSGVPTDIFLKDRFIQAAVAGWIITFGFLIY